MSPENNEVLKILILGTLVFLILCIGLITAVLYSQRRFLNVQLKNLDDLRMNEERFRKIVEGTPVPTFVSVNGIISYVNAAVLSLMKIEHINEILGNSIIQFIAPQPRNPLHQQIAYTIQKNEQVLPAEISLARYDGNILDVEIAAIPVFFNNKQAVLIVLRDITEAKRAEEIRREIPRKIISAQENERRRFARELHDGVNQILFNVKGQIETLERKICTNPACGFDSLTPITNPLKMAMQEIQRISRNLRPSALDELGLASAITSMADEFIVRTHIAVSVKGFPQERLTPELELCYYRIVQEALNNIEKHSLATQVVIEYADDGSAMTINIIDNGKGMNRDINAYTSGVGLTTMRERAELIGGSIKISSSQGKGTTVFVHIPKR